MILLLGGTADARAAAALLRESGHDVLLSVVSEHAAALVGRPGEDGTRGYRGDPEQPPLRIRVGALDETELDRLVAVAEVVVDATHPFATQISALAREVCRRRHVPYLRLERPSVDLPAGTIVATDAAAGAAVAVAAGGDGVILVTVGTRTLETYVGAARAAGRRLVARVMPTVESVSRCFELGLSSAEIVAMQGPTHAEMDAALLRHLGATVLVTKESGAVGGLTAKLEACRATGATAVVVARPRTVDAAEDGNPQTEAVSSVYDLTGRLEHLLGSRSAAKESRAAARVAPASLMRGLLQVYTGDGKGKTTAAVGLALRARGRGLTVAMVQFVKGGPESGELAELRRAGVMIVRPALRSTGLIRGVAHHDDERAGLLAWREASALLCSGAWDIVILDELHSALNHGLIDLRQVRDTLAKRPPWVEVVTTGRSAPAELRAVADLVTEMVSCKHPYPSVSARRGIEY